VIKTEFYLNEVTDILKKIEKDSGESIDQAANLMGKTILSEKLINVIGTGGHSNIGAMELFWRAGGLVPINALLDPGIDLAHGAKHSNIMERTLGYGKSVLESYYLKEGEILIIVNAYGINTMTIEVAIEAKKKGLKTIGVSSTGFANSVPKTHPARHPSGKNLHEIVDIFVNNHMPLGDAIVKFDNLEQRVAPVSIICNSFALNLMVIRTVEKILEEGMIPPIWTSANLPGGDEANKNYEEIYGNRVKHLI
jgi:uncharacterized phosphosugar-binding protein